MPSAQNRPRPDDRTTRSGSRSGFATALVLGACGSVLFAAGLPGQTASPGQAGGGASTVRRASLKRVALDVSDLSTPAVERSVESGLAWLAQAQDPGGYWPAHVGHKRMDSYMLFRTAEQQRAARQGHVGVTALAGMAFLAGGHAPRRGKYGDVVAKTLDYTLTRVTEAGLITDAGTRMYGHAFATLFLAEVYGMSRDRRIKKGLERAVHIIVDCQNSYGAWRYNPFTQEADLSVTVCQLQALRAARNIGIEVPRSTIDRAVRYVRDSQTDEGGPYDGLFYYKIHGAGRYRKDTQFSINAAGVTALTSAGVYDRSLLEPAIEFLIREAPRVRRWAPHHFYFWYGNYYTCQALFHADGVIRDGCFEKYYRETRDHLLEDQKKDGRWRNDTGPGDVFATAVACIVLQVPKQYLPIFQR